MAWKCLVPSPSLCLHIGAFFILVLPVDFLGTLISVRTCIRAGQTLISKNAVFCLSQKPRALICKRASGALLAALFKVSPVISWRTGSVSTSLHTILNISASKSRSSLWRCIINPPRQHTIAWSTLNWCPHTHTFGVSGISQSYLNLIAFHNSLLFRLKFRPLMGIILSASSMLPFPWLASPLSWFLSAERTSPVLASNPCTHPLLTRA